MELAFQIREQYHGPRPTCPIRQVVTELLLSVPLEHLRGLGSVILTDSASLNRERRREKRSYAGKKKAVVSAPILYHWAWQGQPSWIEVFVDLLDREMPRWGWRIPIVRDIAVGHDLFYLIGAHTYSVTPTSEPTKDQASSYWRRRFLGAFLYRKYWYLWPLIYPIYKRVGTIRGKKRNAAPAKDRGSNPERSGT